MVQAALLVLSATAIGLLACKDKRLSRWGWAFGLASQPFWLAATWGTAQWGIFALSAWYTFHWARGVWNFLAKPALRGDS